MMRVALWNSRRISTTAGLAAVSSSSAKLTTRSAVGLTTDWRTNSRSNQNQKSNTFLFALAAVLSFRPLTTLADSGVNVVPSPKEEGGLQEKEACPFYGCPLYPLDVVEDVPSNPNHNAGHSTSAISALEAMREKTRGEMLPHQNGRSTDEAPAAWLKDLETTAGDDRATLTMTGYKGGSFQSQINQDRAVVISPYFVSQEEQDSAKNRQGQAPVPVRRLLGVFDGHSKLGEAVSQYVVTELPKLLAKKIVQASEELGANAEGPLDEPVDVVKRILNETFVEMDRTAPADVSGGCTASVVYQENNKVFVANTGDSQSFIVVYRKKSMTAEIVYASREDKPSLPDEQARVERMGGSVYLPLVGTSRVIYVNPVTGSQTGLAMSRSIGDWKFGELGVIPDPIVDVVDIEELVRQQIGEDRPECFEMDDYGFVTRKQTPECRDDRSFAAKDDYLDDVHIFAFSATDGMLDYTAAEGIAKVLAMSLFEEDGPLPVVACEMLVSVAAQGWGKYKQNRYRDDIAIAVAALRSPPVDALARDSSSANDESRDEL